MADLSLHAVQWCSQHGHPVLALRTADDRFFIVSLTAEDAMALAPQSTAADFSRPPRRLHHLVEATVAALDGRLTEVYLHVGRDDVLRASLQIDGPRGSLSLPAYFADGVALAHRGHLPLRMADDDLRRVPLTPLVPNESERPLPPPIAPKAAAPAPLPPEAFRSLIASLDLDGLGQPPADAGDDANDGNRVS